VARSFERLTASRSKELVAHLALWTDKTTFAAEVHDRCGGSF
jgi:hypothetical protein